MPFESITTGVVCSTRLQDTKCLTQPKILRERNAKNQTHPTTSMLSLTLRTRMSSRTTSIIAKGRISPSYFSYLADSHLFRRKKTSFSKRVMYGSSGTQPLFNVQDRSSERRNFTTIQDRRPCPSYKFPLTLRRRPTFSGEHTVDRRRQYHATPQREIVPLIAAVGLVAVVARYSYRAVQRMQADMEDYQYALQEYERQKIKEDNLQAATATNGASKTTNSSTPAATLAIDLGTCFTKLASTTPSLDVIVSREGDRSFFNGVVYNSNNTTTASNNIESTGRAALDQYYFHPDGVSTKVNDVQLPYTALIEAAASELLGSTTSSTQTTFAAQRILSDALTVRLKDAIDRNGLSSLNLSEISSSIRHVLTLPVTFMRNPALYVDAFSKINIPNQLSIVPEPVAAIWGAQFYNVLSDANNNQPDNTYLVIDIGGLTTQIAIVRMNVVQHSCTIPMGGETFVEQLVNVLKRGSSSANVLQDSRSLALLQVHSRQAVVELSSQTRVSVHVPYIFSDPSAHHLDTSVARSVLDQAVDQYVKDQLIPDLQMANSTAQPLLSQQMGSPVDLQSMWMSVLTDALEKSGQSPSDIHAVLVVGGGSKCMFAHNTLTSAWHMLTGGGSSVAPIVRPDSALLSELTVLGAATLPPSFDYSLTKGLIPK